MGSYRCMIIWFMDDQPKWHCQQGCWVCSGNGIGHTPVFEKMWLLAGTAASVADEAAKKASECKIKDNHYIILFEVRLALMCLAHCGTCLEGVLLARPCVANLGTWLVGVLLALMCLAHLGKCLVGALLAHITTLSLAQWLVVFSFPKSPLPPLRAKYSAKW